MRILFYLINIRENPWLALPPMCWLHYFGLDIDQSAEHGSNLVLVVVVEVVVVGHTNLFNSRVLKRNVQSSWFGARRCACTAAKKLYKRQLV